MKRALKQLVKQKAIFIASSHGKSGQAMRQLSKNKNERMKIFFIYLFFFCTAFSMFSLTLTPAEKVINSELKKYFAGNKYTLNELVIPTNYSVSGKFYEVKSSIEGKIKYVYAGRVNTTRGNNRSATDAEFFDYIILYNAAQVVQKVKVYNLQTSHGEGVSSTGWLKQFVGYSSQKQLRVGKDIDAISGATISVSKITLDVQSKTSMLGEIVKK